MRLKINGLKLQRGYQKNLKQIPFRDFEMSFCLNIVKVVALLSVFSAKVCSSNQPAYQVSLYLHLYPKEPPIHTCNGIIVQSRLILTAASCVYNKFPPKNSPVVAPINPAIISVRGDSSTAFNDVLTLKVSQVFVADKFNYTTGENDLALLRLNGTLPLDMRDDIKWITLEDDEVYDSPCLANFYVRNSSKDAANYIQSEQMPLLNAESCRNASGGLINREHDICSLYYLPTGFNCNEVETFKNNNVDRGTGLVCGNKLIGVLSTILPWKNTTYCTEKPMRAYFTAVVPHISWIFNIIMEEDTKMFNEGEYISSSPYAGESNAFIETRAPEPATTSQYITTVGNYETTELLPQQNNTAACGKTKGKLFSIILRIIYSIVQAINLWH